MEAAMLQHESRIDKPLETAFQASRNYKQQSVSGTKHRKKDEERRGIGVCWC